MKFTTNLSSEQKKEFCKICSQIIDSYRSKSYLELDDIKSVKLEKSKLKIELVLPYPCATFADEITQQFAILTVLSFVDSVEANLSHKIASHVVQHNLKPLKQIKNIVAIASGKGGVGKSTVACNLALALYKEGASVGILDADIYGPSIPKMLNIAERPKTNDGKTMEPIEKYGLKVMSIGSLVAEDNPVVWRGALVTRTLVQLLEETNWGELDYLIIDLPPGTGDVQLTLSQQIPVTGSIIVTTPQDIALLDAVKGLLMFKKVNVDILGIIENMSYFECKNCGSKTHIFGQGGGQKIAKKYQAKLLGSIPLDIKIREDMDKGKPPILSQADSPIAKEYSEIIRTAMASLALKNKDFTASFPTIEIK